MGSKRITRRNLRGSHAGHPNVRTRVLLPSWHQQSQDHGLRFRSLVFGPMQEINKDLAFPKNHYRIMLNKKFIKELTLMTASITAITKGFQHPALSENRSTWIDTNGHSIQVQGSSIVGIQCEGMSPGGKVESGKQLINAIQATIQCSESPARMTSYFCKRSDMPNVRPWARSCGENGWVKKQ